MNHTLEHPCVYTVILNTNKREDTLECLRSLSANDYPNHHLLVLDNASTDGSVEAIQNEFPQVNILNLTENKGYAGNNNVGMQYALKQGADWIFVLNEDTILSPDCLSLLIKHIQETPNVGIAGRLVYHASEPTVIQSAGGYFDPNWRTLHTGINDPDKGQYQSPYNTDWISGCAMLIKREALEKVGLFDERFFYYNEEVDLNYRVKEAGWKIQLVPAAKLWHKGVQQDYRPSANVTYYKVRNFLLFLSLHQAPFKVKIYAWLEYLRMVASYTLRPKWKDKRDHRDAAIQGMIDFLNHRWGKRPG